MPFSGAGGKTEERAMKNGRNVKRWLAAAMLVLAGVLLAGVAWGGKTAGKAQNPERNVVTDKGEEEWRAEVKAEVGTQLLELVEEAAKFREDSIAEANPVLVAYEQLSHEMQAWFSLFAVLGVIFGFLAPIGLYLLQIKAVDKHESQMKDEIQKAKEEAQRVVTELIDIKVAAAEREMEEVVENKAKEIDIKIATLWKRLGVFVTKTILEASQKIVNEWKNNRDGGGAGYALVLFCAMLEESAFSSGDDRELQGAAKSILNVFGELRGNENAAKWWEPFSSKVAKNIRNFKHEFHFTKDLLGEADYGEWQGYCRELGIRGVE